MMCEFRTWKEWLLAEETEKNEDSSDEFRQESEYVGRHAELSVDPVLRLRSVNTDRNETAEGWNKAPLLS